MNIIREKYYKYVIDTIYKNTKFQEAMNKSLMDVVCYGVSYVKTDEIVDEVEILEYREWLEDLRDKRK